MMKCQNGINAYAIHASRKDGINALETFLPTHDLGKIKDHEKQRQESSES